MSAMARQNHYMSKQGFKTHVSLEACPPHCSPLPWLFTSQTPLLTPFDGVKGSRSLEPANYRVLTSASLSPKSRGSFLQLGGSACVCGPDITGVVGTQICLLSHTVDQFGVEISYIILVAYKQWKHVKESWLK